MSEERFWSEGPKRLREAETGELSFAEQEALRELTELLAATSDPHEREQIKAQIKALLPSSPDTWRSLF